MVFVDFGGIFFFGLVNFLDRVNNFLVSKFFKCILINLEFIWLVIFFIRFFYFELLIICRNYVRGRYYR